MCVYNISLYTLISIDGCPGNNAFGCSTSQNVLLPNGNPECKELLSGTFCAIKADLIFWWFDFEFSGYITSLVIFFTYYRCSHEDVHSGFSTDGQGQRTWTSWLMYIFQELSQRTRLLTPCPRCDLTLGTQCTVYKTPFHLLDPRMHHLKNIQIKLIFEGGGGGGIDWRVGLSFGY